MIDLDHVGLATHDLDGARDVYARLGFTCTAKSTHRGPVPPHGETGAWGSGNYCIMLERGYFELIGVTDASLPHPMVAARLDKYAGLHIVALGCRDGDAAAALRGRMAGVAAPYDLVRDVPYGEGARPVGRARARGASGFIRSTRRRCPRAISSSSSTAPARCCGSPRCWCMPTASPDSTA